MIAVTIDANDIKLLDPCSICGLACRLYCLECQKICYACKKLFSCNPTCDKKAAYNRISYFLYNTKAMDTDTLPSRNGLETSNY